jgi:hypothetical protein
MKQFVPFIAKPLPDLVRKFEAIVATGMPGLYRVIAFLLIERVYDLGDLGRAGSAFSIAQTLAFFTAIGWGALILVRVPVSPDRAHGVQCFYDLVRMGMVTLLVCGTVFAMEEPVLGFGLPVPEIIAILVGWTVYQLGRHYFLAQRSYRFIILTDAALIIVTCVSIFAFRPFGACAGLPLGFSLGTAGVWMFVRIGKPGRFKASRYEFKGLEFGFTNFLSGGIALSLVPIASFTNGPRFAGIMSLIASVSAISALIPRAITMYRLPELSRIAAAGGPLYDLTRRTNREIVLASLATFAANAGIVAAICLINTTADELAMTLACGVAMSAVGCISMSSMAYSNVLMVREASKAAMLINLAACGTYLGAALVLFETSAKLYFPSILAVCIATTVMRNILLKSQSRALCAPSAEIRRA